MNPDQLDDRFAQLREEWPVASMTEHVMARVRTVAVSATSPRRPRRRALTAVALATVLAGIGLTWLYLASRPPSLMAALQDGVVRSRSAHLILSRSDAQGQTHRAQGWYRRGEGFCLESPEGVLVDDGKYEWSWATTDGKNSETIVIRQPSEKVSFARSITQWLNLPDLRSGSRTRLPEKDRAIGGVPCQAYSLTPPADDPGAFVGSPPIAVRAIVLVDAGERLVEVTVQVEKNHSWESGITIQIEYDTDIPPERVAVRMPGRARVIDPETAFTDRYPLERALARVEVGGLLFGVHDARPLKDCEGYYVVTSVRGTPEYLKKYPPRRRRVNMSVPLVLDVARQPAWKQVGNKCNRIVIADAVREGVEIHWWLLLPRRFFIMKNGKKEFIATNPGDDPDRLDVVPGKVRIPLEASYLDEAHRDSRGAMGEVFKWVDVPVPVEATPEPLDQVAGRARRDILVMVRGNLGGLFGVAPGPPQPRTPRALSRLMAEEITDAEFAAAIQRGVDDLCSLDELFDTAAMPPGK
jgi:hypothetical protein